MIGLWKHDSQAIKTINDLDEKGDDVSTTMINVAELYHGAYLRNDTKYFHWIRTLKTWLPVHGFDFRSAEIYGNLMARPKKDRDSRTKDADAFVASIAKARGESAVTNDRDFERLGVDVITW